MRVSPSKSRNSLHLWKNPRGIWYLVWQEDGEPKRQSLRTRNKAAAERELRKLSAKSGRKSNAPETLAAAARAWLAYKENDLHGLTRRTLTAYRTLINRMCEFWGDEERLEDVDPDAVFAFLEWMGSEYGVSPEGQAKRLGLVRSVFKWSVDMGYLTWNPASAVKIRPGRGKKTATMREEDYPALLGDLLAWEAETKDYREGARRIALREVVEILWASGLRSIDLFRLRWENVDLDRRVWRIQRPANKGGDSIWPMPARAVELLTVRRELGGDGPFSEGHSSAKAVRSRWKRFRDLHPHWQGYTLHSLRYGFVTRLKVRGMAWAAKELAGHHTQAMSDHYTVPDEEQLRRALDG